MPRPSRQSTLLNHGVKLATKFGVPNITRRMVAKAAKVSDPLVSHYFGSLQQLHDAIEKEMKAQGKKQPSLDQIVSMGEKMRRKPRRVA